jgi:GNAT superfamily N-acetyltransferase
MKDKEMEIEPFNQDLDCFLSGPGGRELDIDDIFAKNFSKVLEEFVKFSPQDLVPEDDCIYKSLVDESLHYIEVPAGILLMNGIEPIGGYLSCDLSLDEKWQGKGLGAEIVIERCLRYGAVPTWDLDEPAYSRAGAAAHESAWRRARENPEETRQRAERIR